MKGWGLKKIKNYSIVLAIGLTVLLIIGFGKRDANNQLENGENSSSKNWNSENSQGYGKSDVSPESDKQAEEEYVQALKDFPLWEKLPFENRGYKISHYSKPMTIVVYLRGIDKEIVEKEVRQWIKDQGGDEIRHQIEWR